MTPRDIFLNTLNFQPVSRLPRVEWAAWWDKTIARWENEGLPKGLSFEDSLRYFGLDVMQCLMAQAGKASIHNEEEYEAVRGELYTDRLIDTVVENARRLLPAQERGACIVRLFLDGFFWHPRDLLGIEDHLYAFYDQPDLLHRINDDLLEYELRVLDRLLDVMRPDLVGIAEDMSYNNGPMLSKACYDEFLHPYYQKLLVPLKQAGVHVFVYTDGLVTDMIPWLLNSGIEGVYPLERQAGVDLCELRREYPSLLMMGGFDKMTMSRGEDAMRREFERLLPVMRSGGYVLSVDHQTPPEVSLDNYQIYIRLLREYTAGDK